MFYRSYYRTRAAEQLFYVQLLRPGQCQLIFDIGANVGDKTAIFRKICDRVISVEPTPSLVRLLQQRFAGCKNVVVVDKAVGATRGPAQLRLTGGFGGCNTMAQKNFAGPPPASTNTVEVIMATLGDLIGEFGQPDYVKIDVEGLESDVLRGFAEPVPLVSFEANLPRFKAETIECIHLLDRIGGKVLFNFVSTEPPQCFEQGTWMDAAAMKDVVMSTTREYLEIYARSPSGRHSLRGANPDGA